MALKVVLHRHRCPECPAKFNCTTPECAGRETYTCVCCKLRAIEKRLIEKANERHGERR